MCQNRTWKSKEVEKTVPNRTQRLSQVMGGAPSLLRAENWLEAFTKPKWVSRVQPQDHNAWNVWISTWADVQGQRSLDWAYVGQGPRLRKPRTADALPSQPRTWEAAELSYEGKSRTCKPGKLQADQCKSQPLELAPSSRRKPSPECANTIRSQ